MNFDRLVITPRFFRFFSIWILLVMMFTFTGCVQKTPESRKASESPKQQDITGKNIPSDGHFLRVDGGRIWYKITGKGSNIPVILLHGGPGFSSYYLKAFEDLGDERSVVRYDQLGGGKSDKIADTTMFTINHFVSELEALRKHLGYKQIYLLGHSWGTILAFEYYRAYPQNVLSLVLCSAALDIPAWEKNARDLVTTLSESSQVAIRVREAQGKFDAPDYQKALVEFYGKYVYRKPVLTDLDSMFQTANMAIYNYMQGPSEFTITGTLKKYDVTPFLKNIMVPTLYTVGEFDEANPNFVRNFSKMTPGSKFIILPGAAHQTPWDARDENVRVVREFLREQDSNIKSR
jgi:proline-specific peptidase